MKNYALKAAVTVGALSWAATSWGALVTYTFTGDSAAPSSVVSGGSATSVIAGSGITTAPVFATIGNPAPSFEFKDAEGGSLANAVTNNDFVAFSFTPPSQGVDLTTITFDVSTPAGGTSGTRKVQVRYSYASDFSTFATLGESDNLASNAGNWFSYSGTLVDQTLSPSDKTLGTLYVRVYAFTSNAGRQIRLDNIQIIGSVVPEPGSLAMIACAASVLGMRRRRA